MRNFHNVVSDLLEGYYLEDLDVHIEPDANEYGVYTVKIKQNNFSVTYEAILGRIPMVRVLNLQCNEESYDEDLDFTNSFQSELIDELYCNDVE